MISAMPLMPIPPMPTKWIVPMAKGIGFMPRPPQAPALGAPGASR